MEIQSVLNQREQRYGNFLRHSEITQALKKILVDNQRTPLDPDMQESLDMICHKLGRIANGDPYYADSWVDIAGYAKLVADRLHSNELGCLPLEGEHT